MPLTPGTRLGPYEIVAPIGAGGMGEVYRARDAKLNRDVALKVLPASFASDPDRLARFRREAQVLASLNHPNIGHIYGFEDSGTTHALVLELIEGPTLADRIAQGPIPLAEALPIARQIADALEVAHEQGIIHRDLKPANIKVRDDGTVKVLDFGLAKALDPTTSSDAQVMNSPTLTARATQMGVILGTAAYMAPEQARGRAVDKRADIWAFGVVVFEMLTGQRVFKGDEMSDVLAAVLRQDIDWTGLPGDTPLRLRHLLKRCLERDQKTRLRDIGEARVEIAKIEHGVTEASGGSVPGPVSVQPRWRAALPGALLGAAGVALVVMLMTWAPWRTPPAPGPVRLRASLGADGLLAVRFRGSPVLSPDGSTLVFAGVTEGKGLNDSQLFVRKLDQLQAIALTGTERAVDPFFSPNGQWLAFFADDKLKKVSVTGGAVTVLCDVTNPRGGTWADDDTIVFSPNVGSPGLKRIAAAGGATTDVATMPPGMLTQRWPDALPGNAGVLYTEHTDISDFDAANLVVAPAGGTPKIVVRGGYKGRYLASGHLIYFHLGKLLAARFDLTRLEVVSQAVPVLDGVMADSSTASVLLAVSSTGTLVYVPGAAFGQANPMNWMTRDGTVSVLREIPAAWESPSFSPDGQMLALDISDGKQRDIFVYEWASGRLNQLTFDASNEAGPIWSRDGKRITFASDRASPGTGNLYSVKADGTGGLERLTESAADQRPGSWDPTDQTLVFEETDASDVSRVMVLKKPGAPTVFIEVGRSVRRSVAPSLSPDGRWIAYRGQDGVYVRPFPGPGGQWRMTVGTSNAATASGIFPRWSAAGPELLFLSGNDVHVVQYSVVGDEFRAGTPALWSPTHYQLLGLRGAPYALHPDGKRLALLAPRGLTVATTDHVVFVFNFFDELRRLVPGTSR